MTRKQTFGYYSVCGASIGNVRSAIIMLERQAEMKFTVEYEQEEDGRWLEVKELPGVLRRAPCATSRPDFGIACCYGSTWNGESLPL
jgi:hypothetical protein